MCIRDSHRNDHGPSGIYHAEFIHQNISGHHTAAEIHGKHKKHGQKASGAAFLSGKRISAQHGPDQIQHRTYNQIKYGV